MFDENELLVSRYAKYHLASEYIILYLKFSTTETKLYKCVILMPRFSLLTHIVISPLPTAIKFTQIQIIESMVKLE